jgi:signal transduction histidine kinase
MRLRLRLFLLLAGFALLVVVCQALLVRSLAARLGSDVRTVAVSVGEEILSGFTVVTEDLRPGPSGPQREIVALRLSIEPGAGSPAATDDPAAAKPLGTELQWEERHELLLREVGPAGDGEAPRRQLLQSETIVTRGAPGGLSLEPGQEGGVLFLRSPLQERRIPIPAAPVASTVERFSAQLLLGSLAVLGFGLVAAVVVAYRTTRPLAELARAAQRLGDGELGIALPVGRRDEIGELVGAFNGMSARLAQLDRDNRRLAESEHLSELGEVARGLAHTLRNPLNALGLAVERLAGPLAPGEAEELAERCRQQIRRVDGSLRGFLALASAAAARPAPVELGGLAREVALEALQDAAGRVRIDVEAGARLELPAVEAELKAMLQALVVNACEASPDGGRVVVRVAADGAPGVGAAEPTARFEVDDEGAGVAAEIAPRLFAPHVTTKPHGSGMGLYLAQRLAQTRYSGSVTLAPRADGAGTRATLTVAARRAEAA